MQFDYDSTAVRPSDLPGELVAQHLIQSHSCVIEGHCDERGTEDYNVSLGERRALAVLDELLRLGISRDRLRTTIWGESATHGWPHRGRSESPGRICPLATS